MGFFATFWIWLNTQLTGYIGDNTARVALTLEPVIVSLATIYTMVWGYLQLTGKIEEPFVTGLKRIVVLAVVLGVSLRLWLYNSLIVDTFYTAPAQLAAAVVGSPDPVGTIDAIWERGGAVAGYLWSKGGVINGDVGFYLAGIVVWLLMGLLCVYTMFLIALASIASAVLLALGPLFIALLLFDSTRRYFEAWIAQLATYAFITILTVLVAALLLQIVESYAAQTAARGASIATVDALNMVLVAALVFLLMRQKWFRVENPSATAGYARHEACMYPSLYPLLIGRQLARLRMGAVRRVPEISCSRGQSSATRIPLPAPKRRTRRPG